MEPYVFILFFCVLMQFVEACFVPRRGVGWLAPMGFVWGLFGIILAVGAADGTLAVTPDVVVMWALCAVSVVLTIADAVRFVCHINSSSMQ